MLKNCNKTIKSYLHYTSLKKDVLYNYKNYISFILKKFNIGFKIILLPLKKKKKTLLKSPHVTKKAKENFELNFYRFLVIINFNNRLVKVLRSNVPNTIHFKCTIIN